MSFLAKKRIYISQFFSVLALLAIFFISPTINNPLYNFLTESLGIMLVFIGMVGRIFSSIFIGNLKNQKIINYGMYSITRNPLYFFSFIGFLGVLIFTGIITFVVVGFLLL
jgi:protein-S-isoprenylcysteine O-methyltransferase Ste14